MGEAKTTKPINIDQLRDALGMDENPPIVFVETPPPDTDQGELLRDDETEILVKVEGKSSKSLQNVLDSLEYDPEFGRPGRATTKKSVNLDQISAAFDGHAVTLHSNDPTDNEEKTIEVAGLTDAEVSAGLKTVKYDPDFKLDADA